MHQELFKCTYNKIVESLVIYLVQHMVRTRNYDLYGVFFNSEVISVVSNRLWL